MNILDNKDLTVQTTMKTKCVAEHFVEVTTREELVEAVKLGHTRGWNVLILGGGSNTVILRDTVPGLVIKNRYMEKEVLEDTPIYVNIRVGSGYIVNKLVGETVAAGYAGVEYHLGLPGSVGGALYMNSKWTRPVSYFGDSLVAASLIDREGREKQVNRDYFKFAYDYSVLQDTGEIIVDATFAFRKESPDILRTRSKDALDYRSRTQPVSRATSGCFFQNIGEDEMKRLNLPTMSAGYLIEHADLKGMRVGSFVVSEKHANFIIDEGEGRPEDLRELIKTVKDTVRAHYSVDLHEEIRIIQ